MNLDTDERIDKIFSWYSSALMSVANRKLSWPVAQDRTKTYLHMWLSKFSKWAIEHELDDNTTERVVLALVKYAKRNGILKKGASILQHERIYEIALSELDEQDEKEESLFFSIKRSRDYLVENGTDPIVEYLAYRKGIGEYPNIVKLYQSGYLTKHFIAVSKTCRKALGVISKNVRGMLPSDRELLKINQLVILNKKKLISVRRIMKDDLLRL